LTTASSGSIGPPEDGYLVDITRNVEAYLSRI
jgi:hypothetical protein